MIERVLTSPGPLDVRLALGNLRRGRIDPTMEAGPRRVVRATRTPHGPAAAEYRGDGHRVVVVADGPGAEYLLETAPALLGFHDDPAAFTPLHPYVRELHRRAPGLRLGRSDAVVEALVPSVLEQKVAGAEARRSYAQLVRRFGEPAPGPWGLRLPPAPEVLARLPTWEWHRCGVERRRAETIARACARADALERAGTGGSEQLERALLSFQGIGPWTVAEVQTLALGDPDVAGVGDYHRPRMVAYALEGERDADDARMLELLEPFRPHRSRVIRLLTTLHAFPPRRGPRAARRDLEHL